MATCPWAHRLTHTNKLPTDGVQLVGYRPTSIIRPTTRHIMHTIRNTRMDLIFGTPHYIGFVTGQIGAPNEILSMGPRVRRDATGHSTQH